MSDKRDYLNYLGIDDTIKEAYETIFNTEEGQIVLGDLKHTFGFYSESGTCNPNEALREASQRSVVSYIMRLSRQLNETDIDAINRVFANKE